MRFGNGAPVQVCQPSDSNANCGGSGGPVGSGGWQTDGLQVYLSTSGNNVGIGSSVPQAKLDIKGSVIINLQ
jgi:hypothetical protein